MNRLESAIRRLTGKRPQRAVISPSSPFDAFMDERMKNLEQQVAELKLRVNGLIFAVVGAVVVEVVMKLVR